MARDTWYVTTDGTQRVRPLKLLVGDEKQVSIDWNQYVGSKSTTVSSATFTAADSGVASISGAALASGVSTVEIAGVAVGRATVKVAATLASGEVLVRKWLVSVIDPFEDDADGYH